MAVSNVEGWTDFERWLEEYIPKLTLDKYRVLGDRFETLRGIYVSKNPSRKILFTARIQSAFRELRSMGDFATYRLLRQECEASTPYYPRSSYVPPPAPAQNGYGGYQHNPAAASGSRVPAPPQGAYYPTSGVASTSAAAAAAAAPRYGINLADWKPSPMWKPLKALTAMESLPDISEREASSTRRVKRVSFTLPSDVIEKLSRPKSQLPRHSIRLFCTTADNYRVNPAYGQPSVTRNIPIEYPGQPELLYDDSPCLFTAKGLRGKPGSAPPVDVSTSRKGLNLQPGRLTTIQFAHIGPTLKKQQGPAKKYFFQVVLTETSSRDVLFATLKAQTPRHAQVTIDALKAKKAAEDDIVVGSSKMTLKDPLAYMRITLPIRSVKCPHVQCFDAYWWLESNVNTPQFLCPLCSKEMKWEDLFVDGYSLDILNACSDDTDEVTIEPDGEWHTNDNQFGSDAWLRSAPPSIKSRPQSRSPKPALERSRSPSSAEKGKSKEVVILSSDDEDDGDFPLANTRFNGNNGSVNNAPSRGSGVIDLTFDSDDDEDEQPLANGANGSFKGPDQEELRRLEEDMRRELLKRKDSSDAFWSEKRPRPS